MENALVNRAQDAGLVNAVLVPVVANGSALAVHPKEVKRSTENLLSLLPKNDYLEEKHAKDSTLYVPGSSEEGRVYLVLDGHFATYRIEYGSKVGLELLETDNLFGLECLIGPFQTMACCIKDGVTASWKASDLNALRYSNLDFADGVLKTLVQSNLSLTARIGQYGTMCIAERLAVFLAELAEKQISAGEVEDEGTVCLPPYTHDLLSQFIGTSREIVTHYMNIFREESCISYTRREMRVYDPLLLRSVAQKFKHTKHHEEV